MTVLRVYLNLLHLNQINQILQRLNQIAVILSLFIFISCLNQLEIVEKRGYVIFMTFRDIQAEDCYTRYYLDIGAYNYLDVCFEHF